MIGPGLPEFNLHNSILFNPETMATTKTGHTVNSSGACSLYSPLSSNLLVGDALSSRTSFTQ
jgi:hypothetical protein